jgi:hypothetical protein
MSSQITIRAKILDVVYDRDNNLFQLAIEDLSTNDQKGIAIRGIDWGVTPDVPDEIIEKFCLDMKGREKKMIVDIDHSTDFVEKKEDYIDMNQPKFEKMYDNLNDYPLNEIENLINKESETNEN